MRIPETGTAVTQAERAEAAGWDGITFTDSQNLVGDPFVAVALGAQAVDRLRFATGVANAFTRHPAALATVAATVHEATDGRFVLGIGRGDTALFHLGKQPMKVDDFAAAITELQTYLGGGTVDVGGHPSRIQWLDRARQPKVPLDVAVSGPRMIVPGCRARRAGHAGGRCRPRPGRVGARPGPRDRGGRGGPGSGDDLVRRVRQRRLSPRPGRGARDLIARWRRRVRPLLVDAGLDRRGTDH